MPIIFFTLIITFFSLNRTLYASLRKICFSPSKERDSLSEALFSSNNAFYRNFLLNKLFIVLFECLLGLLNNLLMYLKYFDSKGFCHDK